MSNKVNSRVLNFLTYFFISFCGITIIVNLFWSTVKKTSSKSKSSLPSLYVSKNTIRRSDTDETIQLKGVTTMTFDYDNLDSQTLIDRLKIAKTWRINLLGIFISPFQIQNRWGELDKVVEWTKNNHIYIYLMPAINIHNKNHSYADQLAQLDNISKTIAVRYAKYSHILYGLWAEPSGLPWISLVSIFNHSANELRKYNTKAIVLLTGAQFGRFVTKDDKLTVENAIFDIHDYPWANPENARILKMKNPVGILWDKIYKDLPVLIGEFGGVYKEDFGSKEDLYYIKFVLKEVNKKKLNYSAYTIDSEGELGLMNWDNKTPTNKGK